MPQAWDGKAGCAYRRIKIVFKLTFLRKIYEKGNDEGFKRPLCAYTTVLRVSIIEHTPKMPIFYLQEWNKRDI